MLVTSDLAVFGDHDVGRMSVSNAENERRDTVASAGLGERVNGL